MVEVNDGVRWRRCEVGGRGTWCMCGLRAMSPEEGGSSKEGNSAESAPAGEAGGSSEGWDASAGRAYQRAATLFRQGSRDSFKSRDTTIAEFAPEQFAKVSDYPTSRLAGGLGPAGAGIRDASILITSCMLFLLTLGTTLTICVYRRHWFTGPPPEEVSYETLPDSPRSVASV
mmetsp:Transcript_7983/g.18524  ORF Transcript_7983/g.18524 Transcript_7983/m.18524 type:complete len:173 (-) Transcript_7983:57-575(-)